MKNSNFFSNQYILGVILLFLGMYLQSEGRNVSAAIFSLASIMLFLVDLLKKAQHVQNLRQKVKVKIEKNKENRNE